MTASTSSTAVTVWGPNGQPVARADILAARAGAFEGASRTAGAFGSWLPSMGSADADVLYDRDTLAARSRDLIRNDGLASGAMTTLVDNILGTGLTLQAQPDYRALDRDIQWQREWSRAVEALWRGWAEGPDFECDATETQDLHGMGTVAFRGVLYNGDALALALWNTRAPRKYATMLQLVESDRLSNPPGRMHSRTLRGGVEINFRGAPIAYHIRTSHPGDGFLGQGRGFTWARVAAKTRFGRRRVLHLFDKQRADQHRSPPALSSVLGDHKIFSEFTRAELEAALTNAMIAAILETPLDGATLADLFGSGEEFIKLQNDTPSLDLKRNAVLRLLPGETLKSFDPGRPSDSYGPFSETMLNIIATGLNIPYVLLTKDFSKTNYSSARAALLEAWRHFRGRRAFMAKYFYRPSYALWLEEAVNKGEVEAPDFYENKAAYLRSSWYGAGRGSVDPLKEAKGTEVDLGTGVTTLQQECAERGLNWEEVLEQRGREHEKARDEGLTLPGMAGHPQSSDTFNFPDHEDAPGGDGGEKDEEKP